MSDLKQRLRSKYKEVRKGCTTIDLTLFDQAADRIEQLERENSELKEKRFAEQMSGVEFEHDPDLNATITFIPSKELEAIKQSRVNYKATAEAMARQAEESYRQALVRYGEASMSGVDINKLAEKHAQQIREGKHGDI